jgi:hypothetical protein
MKINEITEGTITPTKQVDEAFKINHVDKDENFIGMQPGTKKHKRMKDVLDWTKESDPDLYNKIMNLE